MHTFETPAPFRLDLRNPSGEIHVEVVESLETTVEVRALRDGDEERRVLAATRVELRERGGRPEVLVEVPPRKGGLFSRSAQIQVEVRCPRAGELEAQTRSADVRVHGTMAGVMVRTVSGDVEVDDVEGDARISTTSGDVAVGRVLGGFQLNSISGDAYARAVLGDLTASLISGDLRVEEVRGDVGVTTVSGDQQLEAVLEGDVSLQSVSGDVRVGIARGSRVWLDVKTISGDTASELDLSEEQARDDGPLVVLRGNTVSGDFAVVRGPALAEVA
jgi:DUF4097 and DUF4098 domain-containing protein YvlB